MVLRSRPENDIYSAQKYVLRFVFCFVMSAFLKMFELSELLMKIKNHCTYMNFLVPELTELVMFRFRNSKNNGSIICDDTILHEPLNHHMCCQTHFTSTQHNCFFKITSHDNNKTTSTILIFFKPSSKGRQQNDD